jgi:acyl-CoA reductase-like NAD-dependent aldehyde dehydrogenase
MLKLIFIVDRSLNLSPAIGLPNGVLNVVHGTVPTVNAICTHPKIRAISFVGGNKAGQHIYELYVFILGLLARCRADV